MKKITLLLVCLITGLMANAQWNTDTAVNTLVAAPTVTDSQSITTSTGNTYVVFWHAVAAPTNFELRLQKLDAMGNQQFGSDGILISNSIPMSTFTNQWFMSIDTAENLYVGVTGTNGASGYAFKLNSEGINQWTSDGIDLGGVGYLVRLLPLSTGEVIITWMGGSFEGHLQKYNSAGSPVWTSEVVLSNGNIPARSFEMSDGGFVNIYHQRLGNFGVNSKMYAQRYDSDGVSQWTTPAQLFEDGNNTVYNSEYSSLQDGNVVYVSYKLTNTTRFDAYVQRINPDGTLPWGTMGMDFDTNQTNNWEQEIQIAHEMDSQYIYALCRYTSSGQGDIGTYIQKFDKITGARQFTDNAKAVYPLDGVDGGISPSGNFRLANDKPVFITALGQNLDLTLNINLLDSNGDFVWAEQSKPVASFVADKSRINLNKISNSELVVVFVEDKGNGDQAFAQNFTDDALLSVDDYTATNTLQFINPIEAELKLKSTQTITSVEVYNTLGQLVNNIKANQSNTLSINAQHWARGMYLVLVSTDNGHTQSIKIIKK